MTLPVNLVFSNFPDLPPELIMAPATATQRSKKQVTVAIMQPSTRGANPPCRSSRVRARTEAVVTVVAGSSSSRP
ncbi:hypothetical protein E2C01_082858 [Portunus trituberculatus]|uniref:Uncharacterized protein n=1 Tax=Portunus trituberculatus TaxID=210409 RepID=A0A5B7IQZ9_PORTR|nr:hypothetical protein [Portunus trituberculatus]